MPARPKIQLVKNHGGRSYGLFDAAVVIPTILRPNLKRSVRSIYDHSASPGDWGPVVARAAALRRLAEQRSADSVSEK